jgi:hypothetical protein
MSLRDEPERKTIPELMELCHRVAAVAPPNTLGFRQATERMQEWNDPLALDVRLNLAPEWPKGSLEDKLKRQKLNFLVTLLPLYRISAS